VILVSAGVELKLILLRLHSPISENQSANASFFFHVGKSLPLVVEKIQSRARCHTDAKCLHPACKGYGLDFSQRLKCYHFGSFHLSASTAMRAGDVALADKRGF